MRQQNTNHDRLKNSFSLSLTKCVVYGVLCTKLYESSESQFHMVWKVLNAKATKKVLKVKSYPHRVQKYGKRYKSDF